jgi:uncharacterized protein
MATKKRRKLPYEIRRSRIQGRGAFATRRIREGERIVEYRGERITGREADRRYPFDEDDRHHTFLFTVDEEEDIIIDAAVCGNSARYINHSCDPNCEAVIEDDRVFIYALRDIRKGEELAYDYNFVLEERHTPANKRLYPCHCGARNCRGTILAKKR